MAKSCEHDSYELFEKLIEPLRARARELGYAVGVHGTLKRDIDLIACPWTNEAVEAGILAEELRLVAAKINGYAFLNPREDDRHHRDGQPGYKPWGRLCWSFHLGGGPYIDLSVMPKKDFSWNLYNE